MSPKYISTIKYEIKNEIIPSRFKKNDEYMANEITGVKFGRCGKTLEKNIIEELLSTLISTTLLDLEIKDFNIQISENVLSKKIKTNKNFLNEQKNFDRIKYEKFLLENNQSAPAFELRLKGRELQKNLFDYIGAGTTTPKFLAKKLYEEENRKVEIEYFNLEKFYKKKDEFNDSEIKEFSKENRDQLMVEYIDFDYAIINPKNLIGIDEYNQAFLIKLMKLKLRYLITRI